MNASFIWDSSYNLNIFIATIQWRRKRAKDPLTYTWLNQSISSSTLSTSTIWATPLTAKLRNNNSLITSITGSMRTPWTSMASSWRERSKSSIIVRIWSISTNRPNWWGWMMKYRWISAGSVNSTIHHCWTQRSMIIFIMGRFLCNFLSLWFIPTLAITPILKVCNILSLNLLRECISSNNNKQLAEIMSSTTSLRKLVKI